MTQYLVLGPGRPHDLASPEGRLLRDLLRHEHIWITHSLAVLKCFAANPPGRSLLAFQATGQKYRYVGGPSAVWVRTGLNTSFHLYLPAQYHRIKANGLCIYANLGPSHLYERIGPMEVATWPQAVVDLFYLQQPSVVIWRCLLAAANSGQDVEKLLSQASVLDFRRQHQHLAWKRRWQRLINQPRLGGDETLSVCPNIGKALTNITPG